MLSFSSSCLPVAVAVLALGAAGAGCAVAAPGPAPSGDLWGTYRGGELAFVAGRRTFEHPNWEPLEDQVSVGISYAEPIEDVALKLEGALQWSYDRGTNAVGDEQKARVYDASAGFRLEVGEGRLRPYFGFGGALLVVDLETNDGSSRRDRDLALGGYAKAGLSLRTATHSWFGLELRGLTTEDLIVEGVQLDGDSLQLAVVFGTRF